mmetsp:Transcript_101744/g.172312  ORF Transcript_101744/g.172312 Transcript_101744/m.172312 type:complete len:80 (+) Transcript_101744:32-271(+)
MGGHVATPPPHISAFCAKHIMQMHITHHTMQHFLQRKQGANFSVLRHAVACFNHWCLDIEHILGVQQMRLPSKQAAFAI